MSNTSSTVDRTDLRLGQSPYLFMVYNVSIYFDGVTVKTGNIQKQNGKCNIMVDLAYCK